MANVSMFETSRQLDLSNSFLEAVTKYPSLKVSDNAIFYICTTADVTDLSVPQHDDCIL